MRARYELDGPAGSESARIEGGYVAATWVVTGEKRTFKGVRPAHPFAGAAEGARGGGAVELVGRVSRLNLDDGFTGSGVLAAGSDPNRIDSFDVGVNWFPTWRTAVKLHGLFTDYRDPVAVGGRSLGRERALLLQLQLHF
jgi:phosphate-selective porin OprO/OprP